MGGTPDAPKANLPMLVSVINGENYALAFTDWSAIERWPDRGVPKSFAVIPARDLFALARSANASWVLINRGSPEGLRIGRLQISILADGAIPMGRGHRFFTSYTGVLKECAGPPQVEPPADLIQAVRSRLRSLPAITRAFFFEGVSADVKNLTLGVEFKSGTPDNEIFDAMSALGDSMQGHFGPNRFIDAAVLDGELLRAVERQVPSFYG